MLENSPFTYYNLAIGLLTGFGVFYFLFFKPTVVEYHRFLLLTVAGLLLFLIGGPITELVLPSLVHWVHGLAAFLVILGLYDPLENDLRRDAWADVLLQEPVQVRQQADWMLPIDDAILGLFHSKELVLTPAIIAYNIEYSRAEVNRRLSELETRGFVAKAERGKYRITELGRQYIEGSISRGPLARFRPRRDHRKQP
ncbi:ArsR family transcriptional regulator [Halorubellus sp. JP-L1]|uniref:ArsR family transcriptional regulator n=1 Tax=Halorubellus sp. JP-L1 TaxID=2715753 RepID=UPI0014099C44|nr:ArsR family transcriptional regulator [Halorubellus sp. JP-L1]NHN42970.1 ArsR family transcriptional regulator [Halorubellus sp. JP-L1]